MTETKLDLEEMNMLDIEMEDNPTTMHNKRRESQVPMGWSIPKRGGTKGPKAMCKGCKKYIEREEPRARNNHLVKRWHKGTQVHQFHLQVECLAKQPNEQLEEFFKKKWSLSIARKLQEELQLKKKQNG